MGKRLTAVGRRIVERGCGACKANATIINPHIEQCEAFIHPTYYGDQMTADDDLESWCELCGHARFQHADQWPLYFDDGPDEPTELEAILVTSRPSGITAAGATTTRADGSSVTLTYVTPPPPSVQTLFEAWRERLHQYEMGSNKLSSDEAGQLSACADELAAYFNAQKETRASSAPPAQAPTDDETPVSRLPAVTLSEGQDPRVNRNEVVSAPYEKPTCEYCGRTLTLEAPQTGWRCLDPLCPLATDLAFTKKGRIEALAAAAHVAWSGWMRYVFKKGTHLANGNVVIDNEWRERWQRQIDTPYTELREDEKASDRKEARRFLSIIERTTVEDAACCSPPSAPQADGHATDPLSSGASLGRGLAHEGATSIACTCNKACPLHPHIGWYARRAAEDLALLRGTDNYKRSTMVTGGAPEGERRPPPPNDPPLLHETKALNPWQPETDPLRLAVLGKLAEELSEAAAIVARCQIQGIDESEPVTKVPNRLALEKELADVRATLHMAIDFFGLDAAAIAVREERKVQHLTAWHGLIRAAALPRAPAPDTESK